MRQIQARVAVLKRGAKKAILGPEITRLKQ
jgi:hypothetical protein